MNSRQILILLAGTIAIIFENSNAGKHKAHGLCNKIWNVIKITKLFIT